MSDAMKLTLQLTAIDMLSGIVDRARDRIKSLGSASKDVKKDFDDMTRHVTAGLKSIAVSAYALNKIKPGVAAAADLQEAMLKVKANLGSGAANAQELNTQLRAVKKTAVEIAANAPFSATEVVEIENALLKAGLAMEDVMGKSGAAWAATALASLTGEAPAMIGDSLASIGSQFNLRGSEYGGISDWIVRVDDASATSVPELIQGLRMAGSNAKELGVSAKDSVTALGALAPLGERAGSSFNNMLIGMLGMRKEQQQLMHSYGLKFFDKGKFVGLDRATQQLRDRFGGIKDDQQRLIVLMKIFGEEGGRAAATLISAKKGFQEISDSADKAYSIQQKMGIWGEGFNASMKKLAGTAKTTLAMAFEPLLGVLTKASDLLNNIVGKAGKLMGDNPAAANLVSGTAAVGTAAAAGYGLYRLGRGGAAGRRVLQGVGGVKGLLTGLGGTAAGIASGKAVEAATGVTPVFVTNWPAGGIASAAAGLPVPGGAVGRFAGRAGLVGVAALGGYGVGTVINRGWGRAAEAWTGGKYKGEGWLGEMLYDFLHKEKEQKNDIKVDIAIDGNGRVTTSTNGMNNRVNTVKRGSFFSGLMDLPAGAY